MPLFRRRHVPSDGRWGGQDFVPGLAEAADALGWQPAPRQPFGNQLADTIYDLTRMLYGVEGWTMTGRTRWVSDTTFTDAFSTRSSGRGITMANAWTTIGGPRRRESPVPAACPSARWRCHR